MKKFTLISILFLAIFVLAACSFMGDDDGSSRGGSKRYATTDIAFSQGVCSTGYIEAGEKCLIDPNCDPSTETMELASDGLSLTCEDNGDNSPPSPPPPTCDASNCLASGHKNCVNNQCVCMSGYNLSGNLCVAASTCTANTLDPGATCTSSEATCCKSGVCTSNKCTCNTTTALCPSGRYCHATLATCELQFPDGAVCQSNAQCSNGWCYKTTSSDPHAALPATTNGACKPSSFLIANGDFCTSAAQCSAGVCGSDGKCGGITGNTCSSQTGCRNTHYCELSAVYGNCTLSPPLPPWNTCQPKKASGVGAPCFCNTSTHPYTCETMCLSGSGITVPPHCN